MSPFYGNCRVYGETYVFGEALVYGEARVFGETYVENLVQNCIIYKHNITLAGDYISIGCENHTIEHWKENIDDIGKNNGYNKKEVKAIKYILNGLLIMRRENEK